MIGQLAAALEIQVEDVEEVSEQGREVLAIRLVGGDAGLEGGFGLGDETLMVDLEALFGAAEKRELLRDFRAHALRVGLQLLLGARPLLLGRGQLGAAPAAVGQADAES